jgi:hypothetical protein
MKRLVSGSSILLVTALMFTLSFGCGEGTEGDTGYAEPAQMETTDGTCSAITARSLGAAQQCFLSRECEFGSAECNVAFGTLEELFSDPYCGPAILLDELNGLPSGNPVTMPEGSSRPGEQKHLGLVICTVLSDCGACPVLPAGFCAGAC